jgi:pimeloyl-ACP methyl ester carboxylesterase
VATLVLVHGAHAGGWWWGESRDLLRAAGHEVHAPTLTGLGERAHLAGHGVGLSTHVADVANLLFHEDLRRVVLVGCSYGGMVITGVADLVPERVSALVYVDALVPRDGEAALDLLAPDRRAAMLELRARAESAVPLAADADPRLSPQPLQTLLEPLRLRARPTLPRSFIRFTARPHPSIASSAERVLADEGWRYRELPGRHTAARDRPGEFVALLGTLL